MSESQQTLKLAVCLFDEVTAIDFQGPMELIGFLAPWNVQAGSDGPTHVASKYAIDAVYLGPTAEAIKPTTGPLMVPGRTYDSVGADEQFDIILVPGGAGTQPHLIPASLTSFVKRQAPGARYVLSVCTGSWVLALAGLLGGKRATSNKSLFNVLKAITKDLGIDWVPKARWVVDDAFWTSSGATAGIDMAYAFIHHLVGKEAAEKIRGVTEASVHEQDDDEYATFYNLV